MDINDENFLSAQKIVPVKIEDEMKKSYIDYAMSVIVARALPDVRDGLKPVHRRVLYTLLSVENSVLVYLMKKENHR